MFRKGDVGVGASLYMNRKRGPMIPRFAKERLF
jgi:hypothetical protein